MSILVLGAGGQVGRALLPALAPHGVVVPATRSGLLSDGRPCAIADLDRPAALPQVLDRLRPTTVINAAAYTAVDAAEQDAAGARRVNAEAPGVIARWCAGHGVPFVHYSTDYVFDGKGTVPYREQDPTAPLNIYGLTKRDGEDAVRAAGGHHLIFRIAWIYTAHGRNFLRTMLRLAGQGATLNVVSDQVGSPTTAALVADVTARALASSARLSGTYHLTAAGQVSWYGFAQAIFAEALAAGVLSEAPVIRPVSGATFPAAARRPDWSVLDTSKLQRDLGVQLPDWRGGIRDIIAELKAHPAA